MSRALEGFTAKMSIGIAMLTVIGSLVFAIVSGRSGAEVDRVAPFVAGLLGWGAGVLLCFAASMRAFDRDREDGWVALLARHGVRPSMYLAARIGGLVILTLILMVCGTLIAGAGAMLASHDGHNAVRALQGTLAGVAYAIAFSLVVAPIAMATLAPRGRASGYAYLLSVLILPAFLARFTGQLVPEDWSELVSIPGALDALRDALLGGIDVARAVRALSVLVAISALAALWARAQLKLRLGAEPT